MVAVSACSDPTLVAIDREMEERENSRPPRSYLGKSGLAHGCDRKHWYDFRGASKSSFDAATLRRFADGHLGEDVMAERLRLVPGLKLWTHDNEGRQFGYSTNGGHSRGHADGILIGLIQAPKAKHIWEHKQVAESSFKKLEKLKADLGEKNALQKWNPIYYGQAVQYMDGLSRKWGEKIARHYLTVATPGGRMITSCRTDENPELAVELQAKADRIIASDRPLDRMSENPGWFECKWCNHHATCHEQKVPLPTCGTCAYSTPMEDGDKRWHCAYHDIQNITPDVWLNGCESHQFIPDLVPWRPVDARNLDYVEYALEDGRTFKNGEAHISSRELHSMTTVEALFDPTVLRIRKEFEGRITG